MVNKKAGLTLFLQLKDDIEISVTPDVITLIEGVGMGDLVHENRKSLDHEIKKYLVHENRKKLDHENRKYLVHENRKNLDNENRKYLVHAWCCSRGVCVLECLSSINAKRGNFESCDDSNLTKPILDGSDLAEGYCCHCLYIPTYTPK